MSKRLLVLGVVAIAALLATSTFAANRGVSFEGIGYIHPYDPGPFVASMVWGMTDDGSILLTSPSWSGSYATLTPWPMGDWILVGGAGSYEITGDGSIIMANVGDPSDGYQKAATWLGEVDSWDWIPIPDGFVPCGSSAASFHGMSHNGQYATGLSWVESCTALPYRWDRATDTSVMLPSINGESARGNIVSNDGSMVIGFNQKWCGWRRGAMWVDGTPEFIDGLGENEAKLCNDGSPCCSDSECPDFVDAYCDNVGACDKTGVYCDLSAGRPGVCVGGPTPGNSCYGDYSCYGACASGPNTGNACRYDSECPGTCVNGPNAGNSCTGSYYCPDDPVCNENPNYVSETEKGEAYTATPDADYIAGTVYGQSPYDWSDPNYDPYLWASGWRKNPDGSFTQILPPPDVYPDGSWIPHQMSDDGGKIVGYFGSFFSKYPVLWTEETGTLDFQYFLVSQGLDDLYFWFIDRVSTVNADGTIVGGFGYNYVNPDCPSAYGCLEGWVSSIAKASVCHKDNEPAERTLTISWGSLGNHIGHGDQLGTCEFWEGGGARAAEMRSGNTGVSPEHDARNVTEEEMQSLRGRRFGEGFAPDQSVQQDDGTSSPGPAVQREEPRKRVRASQ